MLDFQEDMLSKYVDMGLKVCNTGRNLSAVRIQVVFHTMRLDVSECV